MRLSFLIFSLSCHHVLQLALADEITVRRQPDGDVFAIPGSCNEACMVLSSNTASPFGSAPSAFNGNYNDSCTCQCNHDLPVFREDLTICVEHIQECETSVSGYFVSGSGLVERVPYVFLPVQSGQIIHPDAEIKFEDVGSPICVITGVQQVGINGWTELRNISNGEFPLRLYRDEERTFLQWVGETRLRESAEGKIVIVKLACKDAHPAATYHGVFTPCVTFRVSGSPSRSSIKEVSFSSDIPIQQGLTSAEYTAIGIASVILALIYVASVSLYLHSRKSRRKASGQNDEPESGQHGFDGVNVCPSDNEGQGHIKSNPLLSISRHFESDTNSAISEADLADKLLQSESESEVENVTSAIIHPHEDYSEPQEQNCNAGPIIGERLPEEDVRVVETTADHGGQHNMPIFPGTQRRKLYFNPAYFERQLLLAPPPAAIEFLLKIREVISIAKHKMAAKRFVPTLNEIPEETSSDRQSSAGRTGRSHRKRANSVQNDSARSLRCSGCPGCSHGSSTPNLPTSRSLADNGPTVGPISGESRVRAWLEDVKLLDTRWRNLEEERLLLARKEQQSGKVVRVARDVDAESARMSSKSLPPIFREGLNGCINEMFESDDCGPSRNAATKRSTRSVTREPGYLDRQADEIAEWAKRNKREHQENAVNASVRRAIENSFKSQLEQLRTEKSVTKSNDSAVSRNSDKPIGRSTPDNLQNKNQINNEKSNMKKSKEITETRVLLDIINGELSARSSSDAKRIMDAVIQELVVAKEKEKEKATKASDYETDSLEKSKVSRKSSSSPVSTADEKSSPALSTALPMDEELTMRNAIIDVQISETISTKTNSVVKNHNLPELVPLRPENYALVSEVYVNDGYTSPTGSDDDSGPEIQYEPENPGHLTIKVVDSPKNYVKQDESEYEPDTLDRKPMKLKINGDITYESQDIVNEVYVDSLERSSQIMLKSKRSFREENDTESTPKPPREYNSLREIYEARLKYQQQQQQQQQQKQQDQKDKQNIELIEKNEKQDNDSSEKDKDRSDSWRANSCKCTSPLLPRHERRQRKADNQPDVVPKPPPTPPADNEAKPPPPPPKMKAVNNFVAKNAQDRSLTGAGNPTTCEEAPVVKEAAPVVGKPPAIGRKPNIAGGSNDRTTTAAKPTKENTASSICKTLIDDKLVKEKAILVPDEVDKQPQVPQLVNADEERRNEKRQQYRRFSKWRNSPNNERTSSRSPNRRSSRSRSQRKSSRSRSRSEKREAESESHQQAPQPPTSPTACTFEDSAYVSSPESTGSRRRLLKHHDDDRQARRSHSNGNNNWASCTESDESTSGNGANSESGAESIETDSVFFGNFRARAERERLAAANRQRHGHQQNNDRGTGADAAASGLQQRPINYQAFQIKSRVY